MFKTAYIVKLENSKYLNYLIKYQVRFIKIKYKKKYCILYVDENNYKKLEQFKDRYQLKLIGILGKRKYQLLLKKYNIYL